MASKEKHTGGTWVALTEVIWTEYPQGGKEDIAMCSLRHRSLKEAYANAARIVQCVNACAGIDDPHEAIQGAREILLRIKTCGAASNAIYIGIEAAISALSPNIEHER